MRRIEKNRKGFTLAEEVVTVLLIGILVASASAILLNAMRIFCQNVIMFNAQSKGIAVMEQLEDRLNYAKEIGGSYGGIAAFQIFPARRTVRTRFCCRSKMTMTGKKNWWRTVICIIPMRRTAKMRFTTSSASWEIMMRRSI